MTESKANEGLYKQVSKLVDDWILMHQDETFNLDTICKQLEVTSRDARTAVTTKLWHLVKDGKLEKNNTIYRYINTIYKEEEWWKAAENYFPLNFPSNHHNDDNSYFGFADCIKLTAGSLLVIAGQTSAGKSAFCRNLLWDNMHQKHCRYMVSETSSSSFRNYANRMTWENWQNGDTKPCFEFIPRYKDFQDIILPDAINIIDWLDIPSGEYYRIGQEMQKIKEKLNNGIAVIAIQKDGNKDYGRGGTFSIELASVYLTIDYDREHNLNWLMVKKAKEWTGEYDPNNKIYGFQITDYGTQFSNIREIRKCKDCYGSGKSRGNECVACSGTGWIDGYRAIKNKIGDDHNGDLPF